MNGPDRVSLHNGTGRVAYDVRAAFVGPMSDPTAVVRKRRLFAPIFAVLAIAVLAASSAGVGVVGVASLMGGVGPNAPSGKGTDAPPIASKAAGTSPLDQALARIGSVWDRMSVGERAEYVSSIERSTPAQIGAQSGLTPSEAASYRAWLVAHPDAIFQTFGGTSGLEEGLIVAGAGCGVGAFGGAIVGGPVGAGVGCAVGAIGGLLLDDYFGQSAGGIALVNENGIQRSEGTSFTNYLNITQAAFTNYLSGWNATLYAWESAADSAAVNQIGNSSFNYVQDIGQSFVGYQFDSLTEPTFAQIGAAVAQLDNVEYSIYSTPGLTTYDYFLFGDGACMGGGTCSPQWYGGVNDEQEVTAGTNGQAISILVNSTFALSCSGGQWGQLVNADDGARAELISNNSSTTGNVIYSDWTGQAGAYILYGSASGTSGCSITGNGILQIPKAPSVGQVVTNNGIYYCGPKKAPNTCNPLNHVIVAGSQPDTVQLYNSSCSCAIQPSQTFLGASEIAWAKQVSSMIESAESNAYTYWAYLRALGYNSTGSIPSDCVIPAPDLATPSYNLNDQALTINTTEALYGAELNSLAVFFDTPPGTSTFCKGHAQFTFGSGAGPVLGENITGFVLTLPIGAHQRWKSPHTWALNGSNPGITAQETIVGATNATPTGLTLWPTVTTVKIPLNTIVLVADNNPLELMDSQTFQQYVLYGNGSTQPAAGTLGDTASTTNPGVSLYLTTCSIDGVNENPCVLNYTVLTTDIGNISCYPNCATGSGLTIVAGSGSCGSGVPFFGAIAAGVAGAVSSVPFIGGVACDVGWLVVAIIAIILIVVVVWIVGAIFRRS